MENIFNDSEDSLRTLCGEADYGCLVQQRYSAERLWTDDITTLKNLFPSKRYLAHLIYGQFNLYDRRTAIEQAVNRRETQDPDLLQWVNNRLDRLSSHQDSSLVDWLRRLQQNLKSKPTTSAIAQSVAVVQSVAKVLVEAWRRPFEDPLGVVDYLLGELEENVRQWLDDSFYHAAWTVLLQSSGWGKSRAVCQLHTRGVHVVYLSFMSSRSSGYPRQSPVSTLVSGGDGSDPRFVAAWIFSILPELVGTTPTQWMERQMGEKSAQELAESVRERYAVLRKDVANVPQQILREGEEWDKTQLQAWVKRETDKLSLGKMKVLIHLDEAATFFRDVPGSFLATRRFFSCITRGSWIFGLVSDTAGKLGLVFPEKMYDAGKLGLVFPEKMFDPSARAKQPDAKLFKPVWVVGTLWGNSKQLVQLMNSLEDLTIPSLEVTRELFKWGRPLWRSVVEGAGSAAGDLGEVVGFAIEKLLGGITKVALETNKAVMTNGMGMAILGVAAGLDVVAWSDLARDMVANHMRTVSYIAGERDMVYSADALEPILGEAAACILDLHLNQVLTVAEAVLKQGYVIEGPRGEIVGRLVMVLAMHDLCRKTSNRLPDNTYSHPVNLQDFLTKLCGERVEAEGLVCFNRFIMLNRREITREHLLICFISCVAIIPQRGQEAFDALLAVLLPGPDGKYKVRADRMVGLPVQFKNRISTSVSSVDAESLATWSRKFYFEKGVVVEVEEGEDVDCINSKSERQRVGESTNLDLPLGIYMHLGGGKKFKEKHDHEVDNRNGKVLIFRGLNYPFLKAQDQNSLQQLRSAFFKLDDYLKGKQGTIVRHNLSNYFKPMEKDRFLDLLVEGRDEEDMDFLVEGRDEEDIRDEEDMRTYSARKSSRKSSRKKMKWV